MNDLAEKPTLATRKCSQWVINQIKPNYSHWVGGSADLTGSNLTQAKEDIGFSAENPHGRYINYGVREFGMAARASGLELSGLYRTYCGTFLTFSDYARNAIRMAAMMRLPVTYVLTHDSIGLGEDGPTHQPIEHLNSLRLIPHLDVWRPADLAETYVAWKCALESKNPSVLALSRQSLPTLSSKPDFHAISKGAYVIYQSDSMPQCVILSTGSEVSLALKVAENLIKEDISCRVVSMPCLEIFAKQSTSFQESIIPKEAHKVAIEAGSSDLWYRWVGQEGQIFALNDYGHSAPAQDVYRVMGLTVESICSKIYNNVLN